MAEIQLVPTAFNPANEQQQQPANPAAAAGGTATDIQRPDAVVQNIEDVIDLNADDEGGNAPQDRQAAQDLQIGRQDIQVRLDYDVNESQLYIEFVDPRTDIAITSVPPRTGFDFDPGQIRQEVGLRAVGGETLDRGIPAQPQDLDTGAARTAASELGNDADRLEPIERPRAAQNPDGEQAAGVRQGELTEEPQPIRQEEVQTATPEQFDILENA